MGFLTPIIAGIMILGTLGGGAYVESQAKDVMARYNLSQIGHVLTIYSIDDGRFPKSFGDVIGRGEIKNIQISDYQYKVSADGQKASLYSTQVGNSLCWRSDAGITELKETCYP